MLERNWSGKIKDGWNGFDFGRAAFFNTIVAFTLVLFVIQTNNLFFLIYRELKQKYLST